MAEFVDGEDVEACRGEFESERQAIKTVDDLTDVWVLLGLEFKMRIRAACPADEEIHGLQ